MRRHSARAFSLVELSIVLVILGLLVGGVLSGQSLIRAAEIRSIGVDFNRYLAATYSFRDKYLAFPGDMPNATKFWGAQDAVPATCQATASTSKLTCDGDGDGTLLNNGIVVTYEIHRYWQHLANAGLIEGSYTGLGTDMPTYPDGSTPGINSPKTRVGTTTFQPRYAPACVGNCDDYEYPRSAGHMYFFGTATAFNPDAAALTTTEAWNVDTKFDDGKPGTGRVVTVKAGSAQSWTTTTNACATTNDAVTAVYDLTRTGISCTLQYLWGR